MNNFKLSVAAVLAMSAFATAGGDIEPVVEPIAEVVAPVVDDSGFYIGGAYSLASTDTEYSEIDGWTETFDVDYDAVMLQAGYQYNQYLSIEGRYWTSVGDGEYSYSDGFFSESGEEDGLDLTAWGIYVKPMYPVTEAFDVYALLGYGNVTLDHPEGEWLDENGFQWGLGAAYSFTENVSLFVDYVCLYDDEESGRGWNEDITVNSWNFGLTYKFN